MAAEIRIQQGRAKPIDILYKNLSMETEEFDFEVNEPYQIFKVSFLFFHLLLPSSSFFSLLLPSSPFFSLLLPSSAYKDLTMEFDFDVDVNDYSLPLSSLCSLFSRSISPIPYRFFLSGLLSCRISYVIACGPSRRL